MTKGELEAKLSRLKGDLDAVISGHRGTQPLYEYAKSLGTGYRAYAKAKEVIEGLIAQTEKDLAALPKPSKFEAAKQEFYDNGDWNNETKNYIAALEACRPWVIRNKDSGRLWVFLNGHGAVFLSESEANDYKAGIDAEDYQVVQWEGSE